MEQYHHALCNEIVSFFNKHAIIKPLETIYLGGGTPSTYPGHMLLDTFGKLRKVVPFSPSIEITLEVNPGTVTESQITYWKLVGINRLSIGVQSLNDSVLKTLNRHQTVSQVKSAIERLSQEFTNISIDLILGLPGVPASEWKEMLAQIVCWPIMHLSMYFLTIHENTPLYFGVKNKTIRLPNDDETVDLYYWSIEFLRKHGFAQYEISSFARNGNESKHNKVYWQRKPFKGFGLGAWSFDGTARFHNEKNLMNYLQMAMSDDALTVWAEAITEHEAKIEKIMLGLRQTKGVSYAQLVQDMDAKQKEVFDKTLESLERESFLVRENDTVRLTPKALALEHEIIAQLSL
jgi:oxygen-independent coproporphyrinogen-3 oxidase